jgi:chromosome segregation ATPase
MESAASGGGGNMYTQLEAMMTAVKREAAGLEGLKSRLREMEDIKQRNEDLKGKLQASEKANSDLHLMIENAERGATILREDMQQLNDLYEEERTQHISAQQKFLTQEHEFMHVKGELGFAQREAQKLGDLRKTNQTFSGQLASSQKRLEDERLEWAREKQKLEDKVKDAVKQKDDTSSHVWNLSEEVKGLRGDLKHYEGNMESLQQALANSELRTKQAKEQTVMVWEDALSLSLRRADAEGIEKTSIRKLQIEIAGLQSVIVSKDAQSLMLNSKLAGFQETRNQEKAEVRSKINELLDALTAARNVNADLEVQLTDARERAASSHQNNTEVETQAENLESALKTVNNELAAREEELRLTRLQRDDALSKVQNSSNHFEAMQNQVRDGQTKYWEELQKMKELEGELVSEIEKLTLDIEEGRGSLRLVETEKNELQILMVKEQKIAADTTATLREELDTRTEELSSTRRDRDALQAKVDTLTESVTNFEKTVKKNEALYEKALQSDRSKIQHEIRVKLGRMKNMEEEKQELLKELEQLMMQVSSSQKEISRLKVELDGAKRASSDVELLYTAALTDKEELAQEVKIANRKEQELRDHATKLDSQFRENIARMEVMVKESKKSAVAQVNEISNRVKAAMDDADQMRRDKDALTESERQSRLDKEKAQMELQLLKDSHDNMQLQMAREGAGIKRELSEARAKIKLMQESKSKTDTDNMQVRLDQTRLENECARLKELDKDLEKKLAGSNAECLDVRAELARVNEMYRSAKTKVVDFEQKEAGRLADTERIRDQMVQMENQQKVELRRLRLLVQNSEAENSEMKDAINRTMKESLDAKANLAKVQNSSNTTINGLLEELRSTEENLARERRKSEDSINQYHSRIVDLQSQLERTRGDMEEDVMKVKQHMGEKEHRVIQLESENQRLRNAVSEKDERVTDLERMKQGDRGKLMEFGEQLSRAESALDSVKTELELEQSHRQRVEARLRSLQEEAGSRVNARSDASGPMSSPPRQAAFESYSSQQDVSSIHGGNVSSPPQSPLVPSEDSPSSGGRVNMSFNGGGSGEGNRLSSSRNNSFRQQAPHKSYDDDILAGVSSPPRADGSAYLAQFESENEYDPNAGSYYERMAVATNSSVSDEGRASERENVVNRVTAALSKRMGIGGRPAPLTSSMEGLDQEMQQLSGLKQRSGSGSGLVHGMRDAVRTSATDEEAMAALMADSEYVESDYDGEDQNSDSIQKSILQTQNFLKQRKAARSDDGVARGGSGRRAVAAGRASWTLMVLLVPLKI